MNDNQDEMLRELKKSNELLSELLQVQRDVQSRQRRFWVAAMVQVAIILAVSAWWWTRYGYCVNQGVRVLELSRVYGIS